MKRTMPSPRPYERFEARLRAAARRHFVGRETELALFEQALTAQEPTWSVLYVHGPGGIGKTALLDACQHRAEELGVPVVRLDARGIAPSAASFRQALQQDLAVRTRDDFLAFFSAAPRTLLMLDTCEAIAPLEEWLRNGLLPQLPAQTLVVLASRDPPAPGWRTQAGWSDILRVLPLRNLQPTESASYLAARGIPEDRWGAALESTHGHPLALSLLAEAAAQDQQVMRLEDRADLIELLLDHFVQRLPSAQHRRALEICAHLRVTMENLLAAAMEVEDAHDLFRWLGSLSFVEHGQEGLFPHDIVRDVLEHSLRWRNPKRYREMHLRVRAAALQHFRASSGTAQQRAFFNVMYLHRDNPVMRPFYDWKNLGAGYADGLLPAEYRRVLDLVQRYEGQESAAIAAHWLGRQPEGFTAFRAADGALLGFLATLALHRIEANDNTVDPAVRAALAFMHETRPAPAEEVVLHHRFFMSFDHYQGPSPILSLLAMESARQWLTSAGLGWCFITTADPDFWQPQFSYSNIRRASGADFEVGGRHYGVFAHDWRAEPPARWLEVTGERELETTMTVQQLERLQPERVAPLSRAEFERRVQEAVRNFTRPDLLATSPLLRARMIDSNGPAGPAALQSLLTEAAETLRARPKDEKFYRALLRTYLNPAPTQEAAAEMLGLPFGTYRYQLRTAVRRVADWLWQRELSGLSGR